MRSKLVWKECRGPMFGGKEFPSATNRCTPFVFILRFHNSSRMPLFLLWIKVKMWHVHLLYGIYEGDQNQNFKSHVYHSVFITCCQLRHKPTGFLVDFIVEARFLYIVISFLEAKGARKEGDNVFVKGFGKKCNLMLDMEIIMLQMIFLWKEHFTVPRILKNFKAEKQFWQYLRRTRKYKSLISLHNF